MNATTDAHEATLSLCTSVFILASVHTPAMNAIIDAQHAVISLHTSVFIPVSVHTPAMNVIIVVHAAAISMRTGARIPVIACQVSIESNFPINLSRSCWFKFSRNRR